MNQQTITNTQTRLTKTIAKSHNDLQRAASTALEVERRASLMQTKIGRLIPKLSKAAEKELAQVDKAAPGYGTKQRAYLQATQNLNRAEKHYQLARRQRVMAERMQ